jgi:glycosyltransferase involved in cell wall biosynthesis
MGRITVIIPVFNRAEMVREALESVQQQTRPPDEIIVVDDGSSDGSATASSAFGGVDLVRQSNRGISAARNTGIRRARGNYIAFLDSDDLWQKEKLKQQERFMDAHPEIPLCHTDETWVLRGRRHNPKHYHRKEGGFLFRPSLERCLISPSAVMIRRDLFPVVGLFDESLPVCEDYDLWLRVTARYPVGFLNQALTIKRGGHADQLSRQTPVMDLYRLTALEKILQQRVLPAKEKDAAFSLFLKKAGIVLQGYEKRGKTKEASRMISWINRMKEGYDTRLFDQRSSDT